MMSANVPLAAAFIANIVLGIPLPLTITNVLIFDLLLLTILTQAFTAENHHKYEELPPQSKASLSLWGFFSYTYLYLGLVTTAFALTAYCITLKAYGFDLQVLLDLTTTPVLSDSIDVTLTPTYLDFQSEDVLYLQ